LYKPDMLEVTHFITQGSMSLFRSGVVH